MHVPVAQKEERRQRWVPNPMTDISFGGSLIGSAAGCRWRAHLSEPRRGRGCDEKTARVATASTVWLSLKLSHLVSERPAPRHVLPRSQGVDATPNSTQATCHVNAARAAMSTLHVRS